MRSLAGHAVNNDHSCFTRIVQKANPLLNFMYKVFDIQTDLRTDGINGNRKSVAGSIGRNSAHELDKLIRIDKRKAPAEKVDATASASPIGRSN